MEFGGNEGEDIGMAMPVNYDSIRESSSKLQMLSNVSNGAGASEEISAAGGKKSFVYRECLKNHAASLGGHAVDGCGEFMASGEEGTLEALKCAVCLCHRNFHRREVEGEPCCVFCSRKRGGFVPLGSPQTPLALPVPGLMPLVSSEEHLNAAAAAAAAAAGATAGASAAAKKRFRTRFTNDQKEKMFVFAQKLGWRIQKQDEADVQQFCNEAGVKRYVLKVWMHNNKHTLGKKT